ncbi:MAG: helix-turn-helix transcriptional regulator [Planctomycetota bacterium]
MPRKKLKRPNMRQMTIMSTLISGELYGREIRDACAELGDSIPLGSLYVTLDRMERAGFLKSREGEAIPGRRGNRPTYYKITAAGRRAYDAASIAIGMQGVRRA